jgi:outer membrane receptor protein involved in Fe transport
MVGIGEPMHSSKTSIPIAIFLITIIGALVFGQDARGKRPSPSKNRAASSVAEKAPAPADPEAASAVSDEEALSDEFKLLEIDSLLSFPQVESVSRRTQSIEDSPESVTVLTHEEIQRSGALNVAELLRRVPGVFVLQTFANEYSVGVRGINPLANTHVLFLVDGRQVATQQTGNVPYTELPYLDEIERIEVVRGPASMGYGANAMSGVVNIILKKPLDHPGYEIDARGQLSVIRHKNDKPGDTTFLKDLWMQSGGDAFMAYNFANDSKKLGLRLGAQTGLNPDWPAPSGVPSSSGSYHYNFSGAIDYRPASDWSMYGRLGHSSFRQVVTVLTSAYAYTGRELHFWGAVTAEKQHFLVNPLTLKLSLDGGYKEDAVGVDLTLNKTIDVGSKVSHTMRSIETHGLALLDLTLFEGRNVSAFGGEIRYLESMDLPVEARTVVAGLMLNNQTKLLSDSSLIVDLGARFDYHYLSTLNGSTAAKYWRINPRAAVIWKFSENQSVRFVGASSYRTPTLFNLFAQVGGKLEESWPFQMVAMGNPRLVPEGLISLELGYRGKLFNMVMVDAVIFGQMIEDIIKQSDELSVPFYSVNANSYNQIGMELGFNIIVSTKLSLYLNYTFLYEYNRNTSTVDKEWPMHLYGLGGEWRLPGRNRLCADLYLMFDYRPTNWIAIRDESVNTSVMSLQHQQAADQALLNLRFGHFFYDDRAELYLVIHNLAGFFRNESGLRMLPWESFPALGGSFLIGISVKGG